MLFILGQSSQNVSLQSGTVQGKDRATCDGQPPSLCVLLRGNQKLSASTAPPGQQGGDIRNTQHDPSLSCYSQAFRCCQLPVTNASHSAQPVAVSLIGCSGPGWEGWNCVVPCWVVQWPPCCLYQPYSHGQSAQWGMHGRMQPSITQNYAQEKWRALCEAQKPKAMQDTSVSISLNKEKLPLQTACHLQLLLPGPAQDSSPLSSIVEKHITCIQVTDSGWNEDGQSADQMIRHADFDYTSVGQETWKQLLFLELPLNFNSL